MKIRLDVLLQSKGLAATRQRAQNLIKEGSVKVDGIVASKPGLFVSEDAVLEVCQQEQLVGRGGRKLEGLLSRNALALDGLVCMDVGASTGGFTQCMLRHGAARVLAVDVGRDQLAAELRSDPRVENHEGINVRYLEPEAFGLRVDFVSMDVSFISVTKLLAAVTGQMKPGAALACLIKPQFEAGREHIGKGGIVVRDRKVHRFVLQTVLEHCRALGFVISDLCPSPIAGGDGNVEYLMLAYWNSETVVPYAGDLEEVIDEAFCDHGQSGKGRR